MQVVSLTASGLTLVLALLPIRGDGDRMSMLGLESEARLLLDGGSAGAADAERARRETARTLLINFILMVRYAGV